MHRLGSVALLSTATLAMLVAACGSTSGPSTSAQSSSSSVSSSYPAGKQQVCQARDNLRNSLGALVDPSLLTGGTTAIKAAVDKVQTDFDALKRSAEQTYKPQVDAFQNALKQLQTAVGNLGTNLAKDLQAVGSAIQNVGTTSGDLFNALKTACGP